MLSVSWSQLSWTQPLWGCIYIYTHTYMYTYICPKELCGHSEAEHSREIGYVSYMRNKTYRERLGPVKHLTDLQSLIDSNLIIFVWDCTFAKYYVLGNKPKKLPHFLFSKQELEDSLHAISPRTWNQPKYTCAKNLRGREVRFLGALFSSCYMMAIDKKLL